MANTWKFSIVHVSNPAGNIRGLPVSRIDHRVAISSKTGLPGRKLCKLAERKPRLIAWALFASQRRQKISHDRNREGRTDNAVKKQPDLYEQRPSGCSYFPCSLNSSCRPVHGRNRIRLARDLRPLRGKPGNDVGDFLFR